MFLCQITGNTNDIETAQHDNTNKYVGSSKAAHTVSSPHVHSTSPSRQNYEKRPSNDSKGKNLANLVLRKVNRSSILI